MKRFSIMIAAVLLLTSVLSVFAFAAAETEPNNSMETATPIEFNTDITAKMEDYRDVDWYAVIVPDDGYISVDFDFMTPYVLDKWFVINVYTQNYTGIEQGGGWYVGRVDGEIVSSTGIIGLEAGVYYICIRCEYSGANRDYKMNVSYTATEFCEIEKNNDMHTANEIELEAIYKGSISGKSDQDWYCFNIPANGIVTFDFKHELVNSSKGYWSFWMLRQDGSTSVNGYSNEGPTYIAGKNTEMTSSVCLDAGTYYVKLSSGESGTYNQQKYTYYSSVLYEFKISFTQTDFSEIETNESSAEATPMRLNETYVGFIRNMSDNDWYRIDVPQDGYMTVCVDGKSSAASHIHVRVTRGSRFTDINGYKGPYDAECRYWEFETNQPGETGQIGLSAGTYYIWLSTRSSGSSYSIRVNYTPSAFTELEPNLNAYSATAIELNKVYMGTTSHAADEDFYEFVLKKSNEVTVTFEHMAHDKTITYWDVVLIDTDEKTELKTYSIMGDTPGSLKMGTLPAGRYYIKVSPGKQINGGVYKLSVVEKHDCVGDLVITAQPTCTETGLGERTCTICGQMYDYESIPAKGHLFGEWATDYDATCDHDGKRHRQCTVCQLTEDGSIPQLTHKLGEWKIIRGNIIIPPIVKEQKCEYCGVTEVTEDWGYVWVTVLAGIAAIGLCAGVVAYFKAFRKP